jgi:hypothetical protein
MQQLLCFAPDVLHVRPWPDEILDRLGFDPRSSYVEDFWLGILGPSTVWLLRRFAAGFDFSPEGFDLDLAETARSIGISDRSNRHSPFLRAVNRTLQFGMAHLTGPDQLLVRRRIPPLTRRQLRHLSPALQARHAAWQEEHASSYAGADGAQCTAGTPALPTTVPVLSSYPGAESAQPAGDALSPSRRDAPLVRTSPEAVPAEPNVSHIEAYLPPMARSSS